MRTHHLCGALLIACLAACAGESSAPEATESPRAAATGSTRAAADMFKRAAAEQRGDEAVPAAGGTRLKEALPGGVLPAFHHVVASDLSTRQVHATRTVTLRVRGSSMTFDCARSRASNSEEYRGDARLEQDDPELETGHTRVLSSLASGRVWLRCPSSRYR